MFDIKDFYLLISKELLTETITFAEIIIIISDHDKIIYHSGQSLLFKNKRRWKKVVNYLDVTFNLNDGTYRTYQNQTT